jgi:hypothetical protein
MKNHESCLTTRDSGDGKSARSSYFQCVVVINPETSATATAKGKIGHPSTETLTAETPTAEALLDPCSTSPHRPGKGPG